MHDEYIKLAYNEAFKAYKKGEIPVGCVIVRKNKIISKAHNNRQFKNTVIGHAEINAIIKAEKKTKDWRLDDSVMYVTLLPCDMCKIIINEARIKKIYYMCDKDKTQKFDSEKYIMIKDNIELKSSYEKMLKNFFKNLRK